MAGMDLAAAFKFCYDRHDSIKVKLEDSHIVMKCIPVCSSRGRRAADRGGGPFWAACQPLCVFFIQHSAL